MRSRLEQSSAVFSGRLRVSLQVVECADEAWSDPDFAGRRLRPSVDEDGGALRDNLVRELFFESDGGRLEGCVLFAVDSDGAVPLLPVFEQLAAEEFSDGAEWVLSLPSISAWYAVFTSINICAACSFPDK